MKKGADGAECELPATIDDPAISDEIRKLVGALG